MVKSANRYLGIKDITWESIYEELQNRDKSEKPTSLSQPVSQLPTLILQAKTLKEEKEGKEGKDKKKKRRKKKHLFSTVEC